MFTAICKRIGVWGVQKDRLYLLIGVLCLLGSVTLTANAILTVSNSGMFGDADVTVDSAGTLNLGTASSTAVVIGSSSTPITIPGNLAVNGALTLGSASTTGQLLFRNASTSFTTILQASSSQASNLTFTLPPTAGTTGQAMLTDGSGNFYFANVASSQWTTTLTGISYNGGNVTVGNTLPAGWYDIAAWGDSLTAGTGGTPYLTQLQTLNARVIYNGGVGGDTSTQIATRFLADSTHRSWQTIIWSGRNNYSSQSTVLADIASIVAALPNPKRFLVLSVLNGDYAGLEYSGQSGYAQITALDAALAAAYPNNYLDVRAALVAAYSGANAQDVIDYGHDVPPSTLRSLLDYTGTLNGAIADTSTCTINLTNVTGMVSAGVTLNVDTEKLYVTGATAGNVTGCTRGYAGTTVATHTSGTAYAGLDGVHLGTAGYLGVAPQVNTWLTAHDTNYVPGTADLSAFFASPPPTGTLVPKTNTTNLGTGAQPYAFIRSEERR